MKKLSLYLIIILTILNLSSCEKQTAPEFIHKETVIVNEIPPDSDVVIKIKYRYQKEMNFFYNLNTPFHKTINFTGKEVSVSDANDMPDEEAILRMCKKLNVTRKNYFDEYDRYSELNYSDLNLYIMGKPVDENNHTGIGEKKLILVIERGDNIKVVSGEMEKYDEFLYQHKIRKDNLIYITNKLALDTDKDEIINAVFDTSSNYLNDITDYDEKIKYIYSILDKNAAVSEILPDYKKSNTSSTPDESTDISANPLNYELSYVPLQINFLYVRENKVYIVLKNYENSKDEKVYFIVYDKNTNDVQYAVQIDVQTYSLWCDTKVKILIDRKETDVFNINNDYK
jgi:hypothetical protein